jgi:type II secretory pathway pseudopilin PulG
MSRPRRRRSQRGSTLAEAVVAMAILVTAGVSIVSGLAGASFASDTHRKEVTADAVIRSYAEVIKERSQLGFYVPCASAGAYATPLGGWTPPSGYTATIDPAGPIQYWHTAGGFTTNCSTAAACTGANTCDNGAQLLSLVAMSLDGRDSESLQVIVRTP